MNTHPDTSIAIHEAGHAVVATLCGATVDSVDIIPDTTDNRLGQCRHGGADEGAALMIALAGGVAETLHRAYMIDDHGPVMRYTRRDNQRAASILRKRIGKVGPAAEQAIAEAWHQAADILQRHWPAVEHLAKQLAKQRRIRGESVRFIVNALPTTVGS